jgi:hypothetical protein
VVRLKNWGLQSETANVSQQRKSAGEVWTGTRFSEKAARIERETR